MGTKSLILYSSSSPLHSSSGNHGKIGGEKCNGGSRWGRLLLFLPFATAGACDSSCHGSSRGYSWLGHLFLSSPFSFDEGESRENEGDMVRWFAVFPDLGSYSHGGHRSNRGRVSLDMIENLKGEGSQCSK
ncbi:hypothetical protein TanjilG_31093 [Lupinus angustifolius]|uniref:Uncharacterized protein n=1 Tax=Lupinus angustifolius TaxID=3871 RepID=A0A394DDJ5_LUPAN|nr:hypothetical protein TanjilG_31093 [Lupinus angustifolius]